MTIKSHRELWGTDFPVGAEWDAGVTLPGFRGQQGRWTVRREVDRFVVFFYCFNARQETFLAEFPPTEQGEIDAKTYALVALGNLQIQPAEHSLPSRTGVPPLCAARTVSQEIFA